MDPLTLYGFIAVALMLVCYALEDRSPWFIFAFAISCLMASSYGFLQVHGRSDWSRESGPSLRCANGY